MQENGRLSIILPLLLRTWLEPRWVKPLFLKAVESTICPSSSLDAVDSIVQCYSSMAKSNTVILSQCMSIADRDRMAVLLLSSRKAFQRLYQCAALAASSSFKHGESPSSSRNTTPTHDWDEETSRGTYEDRDAWNLGRSEYEDLAESFLVGGPSLKEAKSYRNATSRLNVHAGLHFEDIAYEYTTPNTTTTFTGEDKHR